MIYEHVFKELEKQKVRYLVIGGVAVILHGHIRTTSDLDLMISFDPKNLEKFFRAVKIMGLRPKIPVPLESLGDAKARKIWIEEKNLKVFSLHNPKNPEELIDIMVLHPLNFEKAYKNKNIYFPRGIKVPVLSIRDLILLKGQAGRPRDKIDIEELKNIEKFKKEEKS